jgi:hypothetical protein
LTFLFDAIEGNIRSTAGPKRRNAMAITQKWKSKTFRVAFFFSNWFWVCYISFYWCFTVYSTSICRRSFDYCSSSCYTMGMTLIRPSNKKIASHFLFFFFFSAADVHRTTATRR